MLALKLHALTLLKCPSDTSPPPSCSSQHVLIMSCGFLALFLCSCALMLSSAILLFVTVNYSDFILFSFFFCVSVGIYCFYTSQCLFLDALYDLLSHQPHCLFPLPVLASFTSLLFISHPSLNSTFVQISNYYFISPYVVLFRPSFTN